MSSSMAKDWNPRAWMTLHKHNSIRITDSKNFKTEKSAKQRRMEFRSIRLFREFFAKPFRPLATYIVNGVYVHLN